MNTKIFFSFLLLFVVSLTTYAQKKDWGIGLRGGEPSGINVKKYLGSGNALDFVLGVGGNGYYKNRSYYKGKYRSSTKLTVNYLWQKELDKNFDLYYGVGGQIGSVRYWDKDKKDEYSSVNLGVTGALGVEFFIPKTPISLYIDISPYFELVPATGWFWFDTGAGFRVNF